MFGYYAIRCWESKYFWLYTNRDSIYWRLFKEFVMTMKNIENKYKFGNKKYKF
jgi:hypothetical protein